MKKFFSKYQDLLEIDLRFLKIKKKIAQEFISLPNQLRISTGLKWMPSVKTFALFFIINAFFAIPGHGQILKKLGKKIEQKVEQRADRKVDKSIEKALDATEIEAEKSLKANPEKNAGDDARNISSTEKKGNQSLTSAVSSTTPPPTTSQMAGGLVMVGDCSDFIWFKQGSTMKFEVQDGKGKIQSQSKMLVNKVFNEGAATVADVAMTANDENEFNMQFKCNGDKLYMDFAAAFEQMMAKNNPENKDALRKTGENVEMGFSDGFMSFPKNMYPGQVLDDAVFTMRTNSANMSMDVTTSLTDRKVVAKEKITTPAGTFECMKVSGNRKTTMSFLGKPRNMGKPSQEHVWIAAGVGTIKQENYNEKGKLESMTHLIEFNM